MISVPSLHSSWEKKLRKKTDKKNMKRLETELKEAAKAQREVLSIKSKMFYLLLVKDTS
jgi:uracil DNA glycosylase